MTDPQKQFLKSYLKAMGILILTSIVVIFILDTVPRMNSKSHIDSIKTQKARLS